jgi:opacity protein-like surface antigen
MKKTLMASLFLVPLMTSAATVRTSSAQSSISTSQESSTGVLSAQQQAQQWGLSDSDWSRYQTLMRGIAALCHRALTR